MHHPNSRVALPLCIILSTGCGIITIESTSDTGTSSDSGETGGGGGGGGVDGTIVDCGDGTKVCMHSNAAMCSEESHYLRRIECAASGSGIPADYIDQTDLGEQCDPTAPEEGVNYPLLGWGADPCSTCNLCYYRAVGYTFGGIDAANLTELNFCPSLLPNDVLGAGICSEPSGSGPVWKCPASLDISGTVEEWDSVNGEWDLTKVVWEAWNDPTCTYATDIYDARSNCESHCWNVNQSYQDDEDNAPEIYRWTPFQCELHSSSEPSIATDPVNDCLNGGPMPSGVAPFKFTGYVSVVSTLGESALIRPMKGAADYTVTDCQGGTCNFELASIEFYSYPTSGLYSDAAGGGGNYAFTQMGITLAEPAQGSLDSVRGAVTFTDDIHSVVSLQDLEINGSLIGSVENRYVSTSQVVGQLSAGTLTLNIIHQSSGYTIYLTLDIY